MGELAETRSPTNQISSEFSASCPPAQGSKLFFLSRLSPSPSPIKVAHGRCSTWSHARWTENTDTLEILLRLRRLRTPPIIRLTRSFSTKMATHATDTTAAGPEAAAEVKPKLHGRAFYESIGSPKYILAPMVDQSEFVSFPLASHELGCLGRMTDSLAFM